LTRTSPSPSSRPLLFICGDLNNFGDLALLFQNLTFARGASRPALVRYWNALPSGIIAQVKAKGGMLIDAKHTLAFLRKASTSDIVIGGGQMIRNNIGMKALCTLLLAVIVVRLCGGNVTTRGLGIGTIKSPLRSKLWRTILNRADKVRVRDGRSQKAARPLLAPHGLIVQTADMAFMPSSLHDQLHECPGIRQHIIVAPCDDSSEGRCFGGPLLGPVINALHRELPDASLSFVPHDIAPGMDVPVCERLAAEYATLNSRMFLPDTLEELLKHYSRSAAILTNRLHAAIFGILSGRPVIVADDGTGKLLALAEMFDLATIDLRAPVSGTLTVDWAKTVLVVDKEARATRIAALAKLSRQNIETRSDWNRHS
jgi:polysaccharide pyruvyl transferase WcaK-like protein